MTYLEIMFIILGHFIADFICQAEQWAVNKSKSNDALIDHTVTYSLVFGAFFLFFISHDFVKVVTFITVTFICHTITDYITSRIVSKKFARKEFGSPIPNFGAFTMIGFDQVLHYAQLFLTFILLKQW